MGILENPGFESDFFGRSKKIVLFSFHFQILHFDILVCYLSPVHVILELLKLPSNLESLFSFNFQLKKCCDQTLHFGTPLNEMKLQSSSLNNSDLYSFRSDFCSAENLKENKDSKFEAISTCRI